MTSSMGLLTYIALAIVGGVLGAKLKIPAGALIGAMLTIIVFKMTTKMHWEIPKGFTFALQVFVGLVVGATFKPEMLGVMKKIALPVTISCVVLVGVGAIMAVIFARLELLDMGTAYLGTSPGALSALVVLAFDSQAQPMLVVCFHFFRVVFIILTAPLIFKWISG
ncbi:MAG: AbrB family transcriptional regulator [Deltaproteobacteria bacterium]|nr:AbrB family transcriptional regulator [Deltaproteobacteria bacterium]MBW2481257.1 AbrB family transcriptional regulator [Deltaproteobacteria bacterium]